MNRDRLRFLVNRDRRLLVDIIADLVNAAWGRDDKLLMALLLKLGITATFR